MALITDPNLDAPDDFYEALINSHRGLDTEQSHALNARLVLLLANHIGQIEVLKAALAAARASGGPDAAAHAAADVDAGATAQPAVAHPGAPQ